MFYTIKNACNKSIGKDSCKLTGKLHKCYQKERILTGIVPPLCPERKSP